jgi:hypothetical protein
MALVLEWRAELKIVATVFVFITQHSFVLSRLISCCSLHTCTCCLLLPGVLFGDRVVKYHDTIVFTDNKNGLR